MRILLLDAEQRSALACTRSLGKAGHNLIVASHQSNPLAGASKYSVETLRCPPPSTQSEQYTEFVLRTLEQYQIDLVLPLTELSCTLVNLPEVHALAFVPLPAEQTVAALRNKALATETAAAAGIAVPHSVLSRSPHQEAARTDLDYPLWVKPVESWAKVDGAWTRLSVIKVDSAADLAAKILNDPLFAATDLLLQEDIQGEGVGVFSLRFGSSDLAWFAHRRLTEKPPEGGVSVLSESIPLPPVLMRAVSDMMQACDWQGVVMMEFRRTPDGRHVFMEANTRLWGSLQLAINAGVNFPVLLVDAFAGEPVTPVMSYQKTTLRWALGELDSTYLTLRNRANSWSAKTKAVLRFLVHPRGTREEIFSFNDPGPGRTALANYLRREP